MSQVHTEFVASTAIDIVVTALSDAGLVRDHNEDSLVIGQWTLCAAETETPQTLVFPISDPLVVAVADGLGGHPGGDVASSLVVRELARAAPTVDSEQRLREVLKACNRALYGIAADQPTLMAPLAPGQDHTVLVTQTLGGGFTYTEVEPHVSAFPHSTEVRWLICSDGLSDLVRNETLGALLQESGDRRAASELWKAAIEAGGDDNITLALVRVAS
jgi:serine/threonine protein phosphatase PrpC